MPRLRGMILHGVSSPASRADLTPQNPCPARPATRKKAALKTRIALPFVTAFVLVMSAGLAAPAVAQTASFPAPRAVSQGAPIDFRSSKWMNDRKVVNNNGEEIADVSDLILDRGTGRVEYVVIKTGSTYGMGGRSIAISFNSFGWEMGTKERLTLPLTPEQLKQFPEYSAENWLSLREPMKGDNNDLRKRLAADAASPGDPYAGNLDVAKKVHVEGEVTSVERVRTSTFGEHVVVSVRTSDNSTKKVTLGPSWYVNSTAAAPMRGDTVVIDALELPRDPDQLLSGTDLRIGDRKLRLRESDGHAAWALKTVESNGSSYSTPYSRYLLLSSLPGMKIDCRGSECGKVQDVILDRHSGEIGFISIDPNQNFLGIGDTKRLVPWAVSVVTLDGMIRMDASKEMVLASPETPSDLSTLSSGTHAERVYKAFAVPAPRFESAPPTSMMHTDGPSAWAAKGSVMTNIAADSATTLHGKVVELSDVKFDDGVPMARAVKIRTSDDAGKDQTVLLGPADYITRQNEICKAGDTVSVEACRTTIAGRAYWIAKSVECKDSRVVMIDGTKAPAWAQR